jgi:predicted adenylyl cyclase CyaB
VKKRTGALVAIEHEVTVNSKEEMKKILALMGYQKAVTITKDRTKTKYNGCEICIDEVDSIGSFIEMEKLSVDGNATQIQEELFTFFESIGIRREDRITKGYDILMLEKIAGE